MGSFAASVAAVLGVVGSDDDAVRAWGAQLSALYGAGFHVLDQRERPGSDEDLARAALESDVDAIVVGNVDPRRALALADATGCALLLARDLPPPSHIVAAIDSSAASAKAARFAVDLSTAWHVRADVIHVEPSYVAGHTPLNARHAVLAGIVGGDADVHSAFLSGDPATSIAHAASGGALVVMGRGVHKRAFGRRAHSVSESVALGTLASVLVVPESPLL